MTKFLLVMKVNCRTRRQDVNCSQGILGVQVSFVVLVSLISAANGIFPSPEIILILLALALIWRQNRRSFIKSFLPFALLLISYQAVRGIADDLSPAKINIENLIEWERTLFSGYIPAAFLQKLLLNQPFTPLVDAASNVAYMSHFVTPILVALAIWQRRQEYYWVYVLGLMLLSYAAFVTYLLFPAAPPWWASQFGYLPEQAVVLTSFVLPTMANVTGINPVAAMPSLHMAYPVYYALFCTYLWRRRVVWIWLMPLAVAFATVYLGHHYVIDLIGGLVYASLTFIVVLLIIKLRSHTGKGSTSGDKRKIVCE